jgi:hypothetical protein
MLDVFCMLIKAFSTVVELGRSRHGIICDGGVEAGWRKRISIGRGPAQVPSLRFSVRRFQPMKNLARRWWMKTTTPSHPCSAAYVDRLTLTGSYSFVHACFSVLRFSTEMCRNKKCIGSQFIQVSLHVSILIINLVRAFSSKLVSDFTSGFYTASAETELPLLHAPSLLWKRLSLMLHKNARGVFFVCNWIIVLICISWCISIKIFSDGAVLAILRFI